jgi:hypothetical protein
VEPESAEHSGVVYAGTAFGRLPVAALALADMECLKLMVSLSILELVQAHIFFVESGRRDVGPKLKAVSLKVYAAFKYF